MITIEQVEQLREKANVSYEEAKEALDASNGDMLDAVIYLEKNGKVTPHQNGGCYTGTHTSANAAGTGTQNAGAENGSGANGSGAQKPAGETFGDLMKRFFDFCCRLIHKGNVNSFDVYKDNVCKASIPITLLVIMLVFAFWITLPLIIIGLFFGLRYRFCGPDFNKSKVNTVMDKAADTADDIKNSINNSACNSSTCNSTGSASSSDSAGGTNSDNNN